MNPGGPGGSGVTLVKNYQYHGLENVTGTDYDIVSFDPRGTNQALPAMNCSIYSSDLRKRHADLEIPLYIESYWKTAEDSAKVIAVACGSTSGGPNDAGPHMTTAVNAKDMTTILTKFAETEDGKRVKTPELLNYWGFSYGTYLGQTFASMFPDRVNRMILDGNTFPEAYLAAGTPQDVAFADDVLALFFEYCHLAGEKCTYNIGRSSNDVRQRFEALLAQYDPQKAEVQHWKTQQ